MNIFLTVYTFFLKHYIQHTIFNFFNTILGFQTMEVPMRRNTLEI